MWITILKKKQPIGLQIPTQNHSWWYVICDGQNSNWFVHRRLRMATSAADLAIANFGWPTQQQRRRWFGHRLSNNCNNVFCWHTMMILYGWEVCGGVWLVVWCGIWRHIITVDWPSDPHVRHTIVIWLQHDGVMFPAVWKKHGCIPCLTSIYCHPGTDYEDICHTARRL